MEEKKMLEVIVKSFTKILNRLEDVNKYLAEEKKNKKDFKEEFTKIFQNLNENLKKAIKKETKNSKKEQEKSIKKEQEKENFEEINYNETKCQNKFNEEEIYNSFLQEKERKNSQANFDRKKQNRLNGKLENVRKLNSSKSEYSMKNKKNKSYFCIEKSAKMKINETYCSIKNKINNLDLQNHSKLNLSSEKSKLFSEQNYKNNQEVFASTDKNNDLNIKQFESDQYIKKKRVNVNNEYTDHKKVNDLEFYREIYSKSENINDGFTDHKKVNDLEFSKDIDKKRENINYRNTNYEKFNEFGSQKYIDYKDLNSRYIMHDKVNDFESQKYIDKKNLNSRHLMDDKVNDLEFNKDINYTNLNSNYIIHDKIHDFESQKYIDNKNLNSRHLIHDKVNDLEFNKDIDYKNLNSKYIIHDKVNDFQSQKYIDNKNLNSRYIIHDKVNYLEFNKDINYKNLNSNYIIHDKVHDFESQKYIDNKNLNSRHLIHDKVNDLEFNKDIDYKNLNTNNVHIKNKECSSYVADKKILRKEKIFENMKTLLEILFLINGEKKNLKYDSEFIKNLSDRIFELDYQSLVVIFENLRNLDQSIASLLFYYSENSKMQIICNFLKDFDLKNTTKFFQIFIEVKELTERDLENLDLKIQNEVPKSCKEKIYACYEKDLENINKLRHEKHPSNCNEKIKLSCGYQDERKPHFKDENYFSDPKINYNEYKKHFIRDVDKISDHLRNLSDGKTNYNEDQTKTLKNLDVDLYNLNNPSGAKMYYNEYKTHTMSDVDKISDHLRNLSDGKTNYKEDRTYTLKNVDVDLYNLNNPSGAKMYYNEYKTHTMSDVDKISDHLNIPSNGQINFKEYKTDTLKNIDKNLDYLRDENTTSDQRIGPNDYKAHISKNSVHKYHNFRYKNSSKDFENNSPFTFDIYDAKNIHFKFENNSLDYKENKTDTFKTLDCKIDNQKYEKNYSGCKENISPFLKNLERKPTTNSKNSSKNFHKDLTPTFFHFYQNSNHIGYERRHLDCSENRPVISTNFDLKNRNFGYEKYSSDSKDDKGYRLMVSKENILTKNDSKEFLRSPNSEYENKMTHFQGKNDINSSINNQISDNKQKQNIKDNNTLLEIYSYLKNHPVSNTHIKNCMDSGNRIFNQNEDFGQLFGLTNAKNNQFEYTDIKNIKDSKINPKPRIITEKSSFNSFDEKFIDTVNNSKMSRQNNNCQIRNTNNEKNITDQNFNTRFTLPLFISKNQNILQLNYMNFNYNLNNWETKSEIKKSKSKIYSNLNASDYKNKKLRNSEVNDKNKKFRNSEVYDKNKKLRNSEVYDKNKKLRYSEVYDKINLFNSYKSHKIYDFHQNESNSSKVFKYENNHSQPTSLYICGDDNKQKKYKLKISINKDLKLFDSGNNFNSKNFQEKLVKKVEKSNETLFYRNNNNKTETPTYHIDKKEKYIINKAASFFNLSQKIECNKEKSNLEHPIEKSKLGNYLDSKKQPKIKKEEHYSMFIPADQDSIFTKNLLEKVENQHYEEGMKQDKNAKKNYRPSQNTSIPNSNIVNTTKNLPIIPEILPKYAKYLNDAKNIKLIKK